MMGLDNNGGAPLSVSSMTEGEAPIHSYAYFTNIIFRTLENSPARIL